MILDSIDIKKEFEILGFYSALKFQWDNGYFYSGESHNFWEAVYVASGEVQATENSRVYKLKAGELIFHAPMEFHSIKSEKNITTNVLIFTFHLNGELPKNISKGVFYLSKEEQTEFKNLFDLIYHFYKNSKDCYAGIECVSKLTSFIIDLNRNHLVEKPLNLSQSAQQYNNIILFMKENIYNNISLDEIAKGKNISVSYIKFLFKKYSGIAPKVYYSKLRCNEAIELLSKGLSPTEISQLMNFSSPNYFSIFFKKITGMSPKKYIRQNINF